ncbi:MAG: hypothetical protein AB1659_06665 [Thermodesulfobacteriota bacterium]
MTSQAKIEKGPFRQSGMIASQLSIREGDTIDYAIHIRYDGEENRMPIQFDFPIPGPAMLVSASSGLMLDENERALKWKGTVKTKEGLDFKVKLVTRPDCASSRTLLGSAGIYWQGGVHWLQSETEIHSKQGPEIHLQIGGVGIGKVEITVLVYVIGGVFFILIIPKIIRWRENKRASLSSVSGKKSFMESWFLYAASFMYVMLIGIAHLMGYLVYEDFRRFHSYPQTDCVLLDKRITVHEVSRTPGKTQSTSTQYKEPLVAVRYIVDGREVIVAGPPQVTSMRSTLDKHVIKELGQYERGRSYPCWYDPLDPGRFVLARGVSWGWYLLGFGPLIVLYFLSRSLFRKLFY